MGKAIQFRGTDAVVDAYRLNGVGPWAVWCQTNILCSSSDIAIDDVDTGAEELTAFLEMLDSHGSTAMYELRVYKVEGVDITNKTPWHRGFGFSLVKAEDRAMISAGGEGGVYHLLKSMDDRMKAMEARLAQAETQQEEEAGEEDDGTVMGKIGSMAMGMLQRPEIQQALAVGALNFMKKFAPKMGKQPAYDEGRKVAGVEQAPYVNLLSPEQIRKVHEAITRLSAKDAKLGDHLSSLADIAENDPGKYNLALKLL